MKSVIVKMSIVQGVPLLNAIDETHMSPFVTILRRRVKKSRDQTKILNETIQNQVNEINKLKCDIISMKLDNSKLLEENSFQKLKIEKLEKTFESSSC